MVREGNRIAGYEVSRESEWDDSQRALVAAYLEWDRQQTADGFSFAEVTSPAADPTNPEQEYGFLAGVPVTLPDGSTHYAPLIDQARRAREDAEERYRKAAGENANMHGLIWPVTRVERGKSPG